jgi:class 3 adenylate cyclase
MSDDLSFVRKALARFPEAPQRAQLVDREDALAWLAVPRTDRDAIRRFLADHPSSRHRGDATEALDALERQQLRATLDLDHARARAAASEATEADRALVSELEWIVASSHLDPTALARDPNEAANALYQMGLIAQSVLADEARAALDFERALAAMGEVQRVVTELNQSPDLRDNPVVVRCSMDHGVVMLGTVGHAGRFDTTVISDVANLAARLQGWCRTAASGSRDVTARGPRAASASAPDTTHVTSAGISTGTRAWGRHGQPWQPTAAGPRGPGGSGASD